MKQSPMTFLTPEDCPPLSPEGETSAEDEALVREAAALLLRIEPDAVVLASMVTLNPEHGRVWRADYRPAAPETPTIWRAVHLAAPRRLRRDANEHGRRRGRAASAHASRRLNLLVDPGVFPRAVGRVSVLAIRVARSALR
jgi:hypothetical protein